MQLISLSRRRNELRPFQATFLVLVRKAASIRPRGMVGNWLYGVAHSTSLKARAMRNKRMAKEREAAARARPAPHIGSTKSEERSTKKANRSMYFFALRSSLFVLCLLFSSPTWLSRGNHRHATGARAGHAGSTACKQRRGAVCWSACGPPFATCRFGRCTNGSGNVHNKDRGHPTGCNWRHDFHSGRNFDGCRSENHAVGQTQDINGVHGGRHFPGRCRWVHLLHANGEPSRVSGRLMGLNTHERAFACISDEWTGEELPRATLVLWTE